MLVAPVRDPSRRCCSPSPLDDGNASGTVLDVERCDLAISGTAPANAPEALVPVEVEALFANSAAPDDHFARALTSSVIGVKGTAATFEVNRDQLVVIIPRQPGESTQSQRVASRVVVECR